ncbi:DUF1905 domain-containing protein [Kriegella sp. EG-1]|nr:DUF1905 domain-containing protein [Flavobacteriaceae bacterium EG-1]
MKYRFTSKMWQHDSPGGWYFVSLPIIISKEIRENLGWQEEGWGRMKSFAAIEEVQWDTAIWFDSKSDTYVLPIKSEIRKKAGIELNTEIEIRIWI